MARGPQYVDDMTIAERSIVGLMETFIDSVIEKNAASDVGEIVIHLEVIEKFGALTPRVSEELLRRYQNAGWHADLFIDDEKLGDIFLLRPLSVG